MGSLLKKSLLLGAMLIVGATSFASLEILEPDSTPTTSTTKWSGAGDLKLRANGTVVDLQNKYGLLIRPTKGGVDNDIIIEFGNVAKGETTGFITSGFEAYVVSNATNNGGLLKHKLKGKVDQNGETDVTTAIKAEFIPRDYITNPIDIVTGENNNLMESPIWVSVSGRSTKLGTIYHNLSSSLEGNSRDFSGTVNSKLRVENNAPTGSFSVDAGKVRVTVTDFQKVYGDNGVALENRG